MSEVLPRVFFSFPTRLGTPGIGTTAWHQVMGLARLGVEVSLVAGSVERAVPGVDVVAETMRVQAMKIPYRAIGLERAMTWHDRRAARIVQQMHAEIDVVHAWPGGAERTLTAASRQGIPGLLERPNAHTAFAFDAVAEECERIGVDVATGSPHAFDADKLDREEREYAAAGGLLCPSDFVARTFIDRGFATRNLLRHHYGFDPADFSPRQESGRPRPFTVVFVGTGEPRKGLHTALTAWTSSPCAETGRFFIAGSIEPAYRTRLEPLLAHPSVQELGYVADPAATMAESDALVLPSVEEGSALVTYEARGCGCVLLVSDHSGAPCRHDHDALVHTAGDVNALRSHLTRLATEPQTLERLRGASLAGVPDITWASAAQSLVEAYALAAARHAAARRTG